MEDSNNLSVKCWNVILHRPFSPTQLITVKWRLDTKLFSNYNCQIRTGHLIIFKLHVTVITAEKENPPLTISKDPFSEPTVKISSQSTSNGRSCTLQLCKKANFHKENQLTWEHEKCLHVNSSWRSREIQKYHQENAIRKTKTEYITKKSIFCLEFSPIGTPLQSLAPAPHSLVALSLFKTAPDPSILFSPLLPFLFPEAKNSHYLKEKPIKSLLHLSLRAPPLAKLIDQLWDRLILRRSIVHQWRGGLQAAREAARVRRRAARSRCCWAGSRSGSSSARATSPRCTTPAT